ncbi:MAG: hypothetical protein JJU34_18895 [Lunatimonas sp.]|uniref:hypothetical protein n=1 Tax=Lunatimonas sp. TaxID=2060141 RepID=UPI00263AD383|nr:hypothetical protein [Lunatimonas sp.]MCC5939355.1 hypothetical protein [Lunatimonas sp.]
MLLANASGRYPRTDFPDLRDKGYREIGTGIASSGILWYLRYQMPMPGTHSG